MTTIARRTEPATYPDGPRPGSLPGPRAAWALTGDAWLPGVRLIRAEFLKLTRRRGLMIMAAALTAGAVIASFLVRTGVLPGVCYALMAILLGVSAGTADVTAGVFSGLVATGRSPVALFLARIPAGLALSIAFTMAGYAVAVASSVLLAGSQHAPAHRLVPIPPAQLILAGGGWLILNTVMAYLLSLGLSSVTGSQPITVAVMLALNMFVMPVLAVINTLPNIRQLLPGIALYQLQPPAISQFSSPSLIMSTTMIAVVLIGWAALAVGAGIWRTTSRDA
jgi:hypothetical protein